VRSKCPNNDPGALPSLGRKTAHSIVWIVAISQKPRRPRREIVELVATKKQLKNRSHTITTAAFAMDIGSFSPVIPSGGYSVP
jgi:hypothetical protein